MCHCGNTGVERTPNKSQNTKLILEKKILLPLLPGFKFATFWSRVQHSYQQAIPVCCSPHLFCVVDAFQCKYEWHFFYTKYMFILFSSTKMNMVRGHPSLQDHNLGNFLIYFYVKESFPKVHLPFCGVRASWGIALCPVCCLYSSIITCLAVHKASGFGMSQIKAWSVFIDFSLMCTTGTVTGHMTSLVDVPPRWRTCSRLLHKRSDVS